MRENEKTEAKAEAPVAAPPVVRQCVLQTDGNVLRIVHNTMQMLELRTAAEMLLAQVNAELNRQAQPKPPPETPKPED